MKKTPQQFKKFEGRKSNAAIKEQFKQEKRKVKKEREAYFDKKKAEFREQKGLLPLKKPGTTPDAPTPTITKKIDTTALMPLNKFVAHSGICGRREAADLVKKGLVKVDDVVVTEPGFKITPGAVVKVNGKRAILSKNLVYILLNKPKDYLTTTDDPQKRKTVFDIIKSATTERIYPVGRLDRNTSGVLLLTNDGELAQQLTHPSNEIRKIYHATLDKPLDKKDFDKIIKGVMLEDGLATVDALAYNDIKDKRHVGLEIHSGRNRIVRRIFEAIGYDVKGLDRVTFGSLTKKNIERGKWRFLNEKEVRDLKYFKKGK